MKQSIKLSMLIVIILIGIGVFYHFNRPAKSLDYSTYFSYTASDTAKLKTLSSDHSITEQRLRDWDDVILDQIRSFRLGDKDASRLLAYVYVAQRDAAVLSYQTKGHFVGSIGPVTSQVLCLFFQDACDAIKEDIQNTDPYSVALANIVVAKIKDRMAADDKTTKPYPQDAKKSGAEYWHGTTPYFGQEVGSWMPWLIMNSHEFRVPPPPAPNDPAWQKQLAATKTALANITEAQKRIVIFWAGNPGTVTPVGQWIILGNDYLWQHNVPLAKALKIRSVLAMGIDDAVIAVFDSKYTYYIRRPNMLDPSIQTIMPTPNHPSYPAGHSTISSAAATILNFYFPENKKEWDQKRLEASESRVWGGIHFPIDHQQGLILGKKVADAIIKAEEARGASAS